MALLSGSVGFRRYQTPKGRPAFPVAISTNTFKPFEADDPREETSGWVCADNLFDASLTSDRWLDGETIRLTLRTDRRKVPTSLLRRDCEKMQEEWKTRYSRERLTRAEREQIKEAVLKSLLARALPDIKGIDCYWDTAKGEVLFFSSSEKANETFRALFEKTFAVTLTPIFPYAAALHALDEAGRTAAETAPETFFSSRRA